jgi:hypothetical protein
MNIVRVPRACACISLHSRLRLGGRHVSVRASGKKAQVAPTNADDCGHSAVIRFLQSDSTHAISGCSVKSEHFLIILNS